MGRHGRTIVQSIRSTLWILGVAAGLTCAGASATEWPVEGVCIGSNGDSIRGGCQAGQVFQCTGDPNRPYTCVPSSKKAGRVSENDGPMGQGTNGHAFGKPSSIADHQAQAIAQAAANREGRYQPAPKPKPNQVPANTAPTLWLYDDPGSAQGVKVADCPDGYVRIPSNYPGRGDMVCLGVPSRPTIVVRSRNPYQPYMTIPNCRKGQKTRRTNWPRTGDMTCVASKGRSPGSGN